MSSNTGVAGGPSDGPPPPSPPSPNPKAPANPPPLETSSSSSDNEPPPAKNPHASQNRWRHQESAAFARHAAREAARAGPPKPPGHHHAIPRDAAVGDKGGVGDLANFLNKTRVAPPSAGGGIGASGSGSAAAAGRYKPITIAAGESDDVGGTGADPSVSGPSAPHDERSLPEMRLDGRREVVCGPLLNYRRMELSSPEAEGEAPKGKWFGSVLIVTKGGGRNTPNVAPPPVLRLRRLGEVEGDNYDSVEPSFEAEMTGALLEQQQASRGGGSSEATAGPAAGNGVAAGAGSGDGKLIEGVCLYSDPRNTFWAFALELDMSPRETKWEYTIASVKYKSRTQSARSCFFVPATTESMRIMFFSCNGFSVGTDEDAWCGPALWNDVLRRHAERPFHVMIGGGDQIYNDAIRVDGPLRPWADIGNPVKRREYPFPEKLRQECDDYYLKNYLRWYATEPFAEANGQIAQLNIWDDHDVSTQSQPLE